MLWYGRHTGATTYDEKRTLIGNPVAAWLQSVESDITHLRRRAHVTRTVYDHLDRPTAVFDARGLETPT